MAGDSLLRWLIGAPLVLLSAYALGRVVERPREARAVLDRVFRRRALKPA
jgi:hypothetical protein